MPRLGTLVAVAVQRAKSNQIWVKTKVPKARPIWTSNWYFERCYFQWKYFHIFCNHKKCQSWRKKSFLGGFSKASGKNHHCNALVHLLHTRARWIIQFQLYEIMAKVPVFRCQKIALRALKQKKRRPLFNANYPPKWCRACLFYA